MSYSSFRRQRGIAIIVAVLMAALVSGLAFILAGRERLWLFQLENRQDYASAQNITLGALNLARLTIRDDGRNNQVDHLAEPWNTPIPAINVEEGRVAGQLSEAQGRFNLTNLIRDGKVYDPAVDAFGRLLSAQGLSARLASDLAAYLKLHVHVLDAEDATSGGKPVDLGELAAIPGFSSEVIRQIEPWVVVLPELTAVNVNFAPPEVLAAIVPGLSLGEAQSILSSRAGKHFATGQAFFDAVPEKWRSQFRNYSWAVQSEYFFVTTESWFGRVHVRYQTLIKRNGRNIPSVIWMKRIHDGR